MRARRPHWFLQATARVLAVLIGTVALAPVAWASLSQAYTATSSIAIGSLVSLDAKATGAVVVADNTNTDRLFGVVVSPSAASISLGGSNTSGQVQVATTGSVTALVSTEGGSLKVGDPIMVSTVAGVGMKASGRVRVIGTAQSPFDGSGDGIAKRTVDTAKGKQEISIGQIPVLIAVGQYNPEAGSNSAVPTWLQDFSNALAGKDVSPLRIVIAGLILLVTLVTVTVLLYAAVRNSIISIGRNPLSRGSVLRSMLEVILISAGIMAVAVIAMYLVITK